MEFPVLPLPVPHNESDSDSGSKRAYATSLPGLAAALRDAGRSPIVMASDSAFRGPKLVPMYRVHKGGPAQETENFVRAIDHILERLGRLSRAYAEWRHFDCGAYFDLTNEQVDRLVRVTERVNTVHVIFFSDLLLPSFREAGRLWEDRFLPAYAQAQQLIANGRNGLEATGGFFREVQPAMIRMWQQTYSIIAETRAQLATSMGYLAANGAQEERYRWRSYWGGKPGMGIDERLLPAWRTIPTLTLALEFPLPMHRQPGRLRRLRRNRDRQRKLQR